MREKVALMTIDRETPWENFIDVTSFHTSDLVFVKILVVFSPEMVTDINVKDLKYFLYFPSIFSLTLKIIHFLLWSKISNNSLL